MKSEYDFSQAEQGKFYHPDAKFHYEKAIKAIMLAQEESRRMGHNFVGTEQILLGLIGEGTGVAAQTLKSLGVNLKDARIEVEKIIGRGSGSVKAEIPFTPKAKRVLELASTEAHQLGDKEIATEHLLLALVREEEGVGARVLENMGVNLSQVRSEIIGRRKGGGLFEGLSDKPIQENLLQKEEQEMIYQNPERSQKYFYLIEQLLRSPQSQHESILDDNSELLDAGLIEMIRQRGEAEQNKGNIQDAELLNSIAEQITKTLPSPVSTSSLPVSSETLESNNPIAEEVDTSRQIKFILELLSLIFDHDANPQYIYPYLRKNLNLLNEKLIDILQNHVFPMVKNVSLEQVNWMAYSLGNLGTLLINFDYGDKPTNIEIAIVSLQNSTSIYGKTKETNPKNWIFTQSELAKAYRNRLRGNPAENIEQSISIYLEISKLEDQNSTEWANGQLNLAVAYIHRIQGNKKDNFCLAEECFKKASKVYLEQDLVEEWAVLEYNFGKFYDDFINFKLEEDTEKITELREKSIQCWENALQVWKRLSHGKQWGYAQYTLAQAYNERKIGDPIENQQRSIFHYKQALLFKTKQDYPLDWAETQKHLGNAYRDMGTNQNNNSFRIENYQQAIHHYRESLKVFTESQEIFTESQFSQLRENITNQIEVLQQYCNPQKTPTDDNEYIKIAQTGNQDIEVDVKTLKDLIELCKKENNLKLWAELQNLLGMTYKESLEGNVNDNLLKSVNCYENALQFYTITNHPKEWAECQINLAKTYEILLGKDREKNLLKAIECYQQVCLFYTRDKYPEKWAWNQIYIAMIHKQFVTERAKHLEKAKQFIEQAIEVFSNKPEYQKNWAKAITNLAMILNLRIEGDKAANQEQAIKLYKESLKILTNNTFPNEWAINQCNLANTYLSRLNGKKSENIEEAIEYCKKALSVYQRQSHRKNWCEVMNTMAKAYFDRLQGDPITNKEKSLDYYNKTLEVLNQEIDPEKWAEIQHNLAALYTERKSGNVKKNLLDAISCCEKAFLVYTKYQYPLKWADTYIELGIAHRNLEDWEKSINAFNYALEVYRVDNFPDRYLIVKNNLGTIYLRRADEESDVKSKLSYCKQARNCLEEALKIANQKSAPELYISLHTNLNSIYIEQLRILSVSGDVVEPSETAKILENSQKCLAHFQQQGAQEMVANIYSNLGKFYQNIQNFPLAYENFARAIDEIENLRVEVISDEESKQKWSAKYDYLYRFIISICLKLGETEAEYKKKAFEYSERNKALSLVEQINSRDRYPDGLSAIEIERLKSLKQEIIRVQQRLYIDAAYQLNNDVLNRTALRQQLENLEKQKNQIIQSKESDFILQEQVKPLDFQEIKSLLTQSDTCAISWYFLPNTALVTFIITPQLSEPYVLSLDHEPVLKEIFDWLASYWEQSKEKDKTKEWIDSLPSRLECFASALKLNKIIEKLQELEKVYNTQYKKMLLIPHWCLHLVPLHALPLSESKCLIDHFQAGVNYIPCSQLLHKISSDRKQLDFNNFFAIQNPTKDLSFASLEVNMIEKLVKPVAPNIKILPEDYATKINLYQSQELKVANCMHFSCHGKFVHQMPLFAGLFLANKEPLTLGEIFELDLRKCYLITLSACETGQVDFYTLSEYVGLPSAFLYAGCSSIVGSLWSVDDQATAFLLIKFYENLLRQLTEKNELNVATALNQAQLWLRDSTTAELQKWVSELKLEGELVEQIQDELEDFYPGEQPYQKSYYWAGFCAVGK